MDFLKNFKIFNIEMRKMKNKKLYVSTPIFYPNGNLHLGHLYSMTIAWSIKNFKKLNGFDVILLTGSDEHGQKIAESAFKQKMTPQEYVDIQANKFKDFWKKYKIDYDIFIRTTNKKHEKTIQTILNKLSQKKFIYKDFYEGLYSVSDEEFFTKIQAEKKDGKFFHPSSGHELKIIKEESYFLKINQFQEWLKEYINKNPNFISSKNVIKELENTFLNQKLEDLSISRNSFDWGIPFPFDKKHVAYVWIDALFSYLSPIGLFDENSNEFQEKWQNEYVEKIHVVGKEITRFHGIYWPIMLKMLDIKLPNTILSHGWLITPQGKMSKSKGNVVDPLSLLESFDCEVIKLYLMFAFSIKRDGIFEEENIKLFYNAFLANNYGNLLSRVSSMYEQNFSEKIKFDINDIDEIDQGILNSILESKKEYINWFNQFELDKAIETIFSLGKKLNNYIDITKPWLLKENKKRLKTILLILLNGIYAMTVFLNPFMPETTKEIVKFLKIKDTSLNKIEDWNKFNDVLIEKINSFFSRVK